MRGFALALAALLLSTGAGERPEREDRRPWEWTLDERLDDRFARAKIQEPETKSNLSSDRLADGVAARRPLEYEIDGRRNPELFLSFELFDALLAGLSPDDLIRTAQRKFRQKALWSIGYNDEKFWSALESVSAGYLGIKEGACTDKACADARCVSRYTALESARRHFGREEFDRVLYLVVAPTMRHATATLDADHRAALQRAEMGCP